MVHLHAHSWFSFGAGASSPRALAERAAGFGQSALALTDDWTLAGAVQHGRACQRLGIKPISGARLVIDEIGLVLLAANSEGYANLCDILTLAHRERFNPQLAFEDLHDHTNGLFALADVRGLVKTAERARLRRNLETLKALFNERLFLEMVYHWRAGDAHLIHQIEAVAQAHGLRVVATNAVRHATPNEYVVFDALSCMRLGLQVGQSHRERPVNEAAFLCDEKYFARLGFRRSALANSEAIARECDVDLLSPEVTPPQAHVPDGLTQRAYLRRLCGVGFRRRFPAGDAAAVRVLEHELKVIGELKLDEFFLTVREVVEFARGSGIRCSGRGSAANSLVAYMLGITEVDPLRHKLLFERFLHEGRRGMPDIDVDFDTSRRHEVISWMNRRWGEEHTAMTANVVTFRLRMATREMAKVLGYPLPLIDRATKLLPSSSVSHIREHHRELAIVLGDSPALDVLCDLVEKLHECPRHLSLHSGGMILSRQPLRHLSPIQTSANGVRQIQFAKDDVESLGLIKFDVLGLRMLSVVSEAQRLVAASREKSEDRVLDVDALPPDDAKTYELIRSGQTLGVFQIESPGQWNLLARTQPQHFDDLVAQVALFRPGPLQGNMVHPYIARRRGLSKTFYPHPSLEPVLRDTYGLILFQEQVLEVAHRFAGMNLSEADEFRRLMSKFRDAGEMEVMREKFVQGAINTHRVHSALANRVFDIVAKFVGYGFCRSHAAAFARTVYQSAYLKAHFPAAYMAGVLEHKPGFYPVHTLLEEARLLGVRVLAPCLLRSGVKYSLERDEGRDAIRVPLTQIKDVSVESARLVVLERMLGAFASPEEAVGRLDLARDEWENLARAGALDEWGTRRDVLFRVRAALRQKPQNEQLALDWRDHSSTRNAIPPMANLRQEERTQWDFETQSLTTGPHPVALRRPDLERLGASTIANLAHQKAASRVLVGGAVISRQRPPTARGMCFIILEDETGRVPTAIIPEVYEKFHRVLRAGSLLLEGKLEDGGALSGNRYRSVLVGRMWPLENACGGWGEYFGVAGHPGERR